MSKPKNDTALAEAVKEPEEKNTETTDTESGPETTAARETEEALAKARKIETGNDQPAETASPKAETSSTAKPTEPPSAPKKGGGMTGGLALIVAVGALATGFGVWQQANQRQTELSERLASTEQALEAAKQTIAAAQSSANKASSEMQALSSQFSALKNQSQTDISELKSELSKVAEVEANAEALKSSVATLTESIKQRQPSDWVVKEARHLITVANHQAQLLGNPGAAAAALSAADARLREIGDPSLLPVREVLTDKIVALRGVAELDISGIALTLARLEQEVDHLPLKHTSTTLGGENAAAEAENIEVKDAESFADKVLADIKSLVSIRRTSADDSIAFLPPGQQFFLQQNLRLKLESARLALLQHDTQTFRSSLATAREWIERYFNSDAAATANMLTTLAPYEQLDLKPALPDISATLRAVDQWLSTHGDKSEVKS